MAECVGNEEISENVKVLWAKLGDVPINSLEEIDEPFEDFPVGTHRGEIWMWFEEHHRAPVYKLMGFA